MHKKRLFIWAAVTSVLLLLFLPFFFVEAVWQMPLIKESKVLIDQKITSFKESWSTIKSIQQIGEKNVKLRRELDELRVKLILNDGIKRENEELSKLLKIKDSYSQYTLIPAHLLNYSETNPNSITIYFPKEYSNVMANKATVVSGMGMVGLVTSFHGNIATVQLITSKQFSVPAVLENREECTVVLQGNGQTLSLRFLDKVCNTPPSEGKMLLTANLSENYSLPHIPLGIIGSLKSDLDSILFLRGESIPLFKKGKLNHLFIIVGDNVRNEKLPF